MQLSEQSILAGHFAKKQLLSRSRLISWSHRGRFNLGLKLAAEFRGKRVLDYGSGDGSFLAMLMRAPSAPALAMGTEVDPRVVENCRARLMTEGLRFVTNDALDSTEHEGAYDAVICMEVLEHVLDVTDVLNRFMRFLAPGGKVLISVPVETGLPLLVKQCVRRYAGWRGIGDYPGMSPYTAGEFVKSILAIGSRQHIVRPIHKNPGSDEFHDHKGFNWMLLKTRLAQDFEIEKTVSSPLTWLSPHLASQVWFLARKRQ